VAGSNTCVTRHDEHLARPGPQRPDATNVTSAAHRRGQQPPGKPDTAAVARQPGLDQNLIRLYGDRVPPCIRARPSRTGLPDTTAGGLAVAQFPCWSH
jgi:hypothetical protein